MCIRDRWGQLAGRRILAIPRMADDTDTLLGQPALDNMLADITRPGFIKRIRNLEADNFVVSGGNENLVHSCNLVLFNTTWSSADGLVTFHQVGESMAARV